MKDETEDPRVSLRDKDVSIRAAAARDLSRTGTVDDLPELLRLAKEDKSPSIRLCAAAAAADVSLRHARSLTDAQRRKLVTAVTTVDPGRNPSLLMSLAAVPTEDVVRRLGRLLRDPRYDVRAGAATALRRLAVCGLGARPAATEVVERGMRAWMTGGKYPPDALLEMVRIIGEAGLGGLAEDLQVMARHPGLHEAAKQASARLAAATNSESWEGLWVSWGVDVLQPEPDAPVDWVAVDGASGVGPGGEQHELNTGVRPAFAGETVRLLWASRPDDEDLVPAFQRGGVAYWRLGGTTLVKACGDVLSALEQEPRAASVAAEALGGVDGVSAKRLRARLLWRAGRHQEALPLLDELTEQAKPKGEDLWVLAHVHEAAGASDQARTAIAEAIAAAPKKCTWRDDAEALAAMLSA